MTEEEGHQQQLEELEQRRDALIAEGQRIVDEAATLPGEVGMAVLDNLRTHIYATQYEHDYIGELESNHE